MKKIIACIISLVLLCSVLCGCGNGRIEDNKATATPFITSGVSPTVSPAIDNGVSTTENGGVTVEEPRNTEAGSNAKGNTTVSPNPTASTMP